MRKDSNAENEGSKRAIRHKENSKMTKAQGFLISNNFKYKWIKLSKNRDWQNG